MPKFSRHGKGKRGHLLGKKRIGNTRKIRGGAPDDKTAMVNAYETTVKLNWTHTERQTKLDMAIKIAETRGHIEILIVNCMVELASKIHEELNDTTSTMAIALKLNAVTPTQPSVVLRDALKTEIDKYKLAVTTAKTIPVTKESVDALMVADASIKETYDNLTTTLEKDKNDLAARIKDSINRGYIPGIVTALKNIYTAIRASNGKRKENKITVTEKEIGTEAYKFLAPKGLAYGEKEPPKESEVKYPGMFAARYYFKNETYKLFENKLKLLCAYDLFERSYAILLKNILVLPADGVVALPPAAPGGPPGPPPDPRALAAAAAVTAIQPADLAAARAALDAAVTAHPGNAPNVRIALDAGGAYDNPAALAVFTAANDDIDIATAALA